MVKWLRLHASTAGGVGSIPGWEEPRAYMPHNLLKPPNNRVKDLNIHFTDESAQMASKHMKRCSISFTLSKCTLKPQWDVTVYLSERLKLKKTSDAEKLNHSYTAGRNGVAILENSLAVSL